MKASSPMESRRIGVVALILIVISALIIRDSMVSSHPRGSVGYATVSSSSKSSSALPYIFSKTEPILASNHAISSQWFCVAPRQLQGTVPGVIDLANVTNRQLSGHAKWINLSGSVVAATSIIVPPRTQVSLASPLASGSYQAVTITVAGGGLGAWETSGGPGGQSINTCSDFTSKTWLFAGGDTLGNDRLAYMIYNPGATQALVQMNFSNASGTLDSTQFQAIEVPPMRLVVEDVTPSLFDESAIGATLTCRLGQVVAFQLELHPPAPASVSAALAPGGSGAVSTLLGVTSTGNLWYFPQGVTSSQEPEDLYLFNTSTMQSEVRLSFFFSQGAASPQVIEVPSQSVLDVAMNSDSRVPPGVSEFLTLKVISGPPIAAFQSIGTTLPSNATTANQGQSKVVPWQTIVAGTREPMLNWIVGGTPESVYSQSPSASYGNTVIVANPASKVARVSFYFLGRGFKEEIRSISNIRIAPKSHVYLEIPQPSSRQSALASINGFEIQATIPAIVVSSNQPVAITQEFTSPGLLGWSAQDGVGVR